MTTAWFWANVYKASLALFALAETGVLDRLARKAATTEEIAEELHLTTRVLAPLLHLAVTAGALAFDGERYSVAAPAALPLIAHESAMSVRQIRRDALIEVLRGAPGRDPMETEGAPSAWTQFVKAMRESARAVAPHIVRATRFRRHQHLLDLGGADGSLAAAVARLTGGSSVTVVDRAPLRAHFAAVAAAHPDARLAFHAGDLAQPETLIPFIQEADGIIASNVMHLLDPETLQSLLRTIAAHARPGATLVVYDQFIDESTIDAPRLMVVDWLLCGYDFHHSLESFAELLRNLGFTDVYSAPVVSLPGGLVGGRVVR